MVGWEVQITGIDGVKVTHRSGAYYDVSIILYRFIKDFINKFIFRLKNVPKCNFTTAMSLKD